MDGVALYFLLIILLNITLAIPVAYVAKRKGRSAGAFFALSFFLSFIVGILVVLAIPAQEVLEENTHSDKIARKNGETLVKCPYCAEWVKAEATVCKHCNRDIKAEVEKIFTDAEAAKLTAELQEEERRKTRELYEQEMQAQLERDRGEERRKRQELFRSKKFKILVTGVAVLLLAAIGGGVILAVQDASHRASIAAEEATAKEIESASAEAKREAKLDWKTSMAECEYAQVYNMKVADDNNSMTFEYLNFEPGGIPDSFYLFTGCVQTNFETENSDPNFTFAWWLEDEGSYCFEYSGNFTQDMEGATVTVRCDPEDRLNRLRRVEITKN